MSAKKPKPDWLSKAAPKAPADPRQVDELVRKAADAIGRAGGEAFPDDEQDGGLAALRRRPRPK